MSQEALHQRCQGQPGSPENLKPDLIYNVIGLMARTNRRPSPRLSERGLVSIPEAVALPHRGADPSSFGCLGNQPCVLTRAGRLGDLPSLGPQGLAFGVSSLAPTKQHSNVCLHSCQCSLVHTEIRMCLDVPPNSRRS